MKRNCEKSWACSRYADSSWTTAVRVSEPQTKNVAAAVSEGDDDRRPRAVEDLERGRGDSPAAPPLGDLPRDERDDEHDEE